MKSSTKILYRSQKGCPVNSHLLLHSDSSLVSSYVSNNEHFHVEIVHSLALNPKTRQKAIELTKMS